MNAKQHVDHPNTGFITPRMASGVLPFLLGNALLGTIGVFVDNARADPLTETWFRCAFGLAGMTAWLMLRRQTGYLRFMRATGPWVLTAGSLMVLAWSLFFAALDHLSAGVAIVLCNMQPMWVLLLGALCLKEPIDKQRMVAAWAAMSGLVLAAGIVEHPAGNGDGASYWLAVALCLFAGVCMACVTIIARRLRGLPAGVLAWWQCAIGTLAVWVWPAQQGWPQWGASWGWLAGLGIIHTGLAYTLMYSGMAHLKTDRIALLQFTYPAVALAIDWIFLGQRLSSLQLAGIAAMAAAIWFTERASRRGAGR